MAEYDHRPLEENYEEHHQKVEDPTALEMENLDRDLKGAVDTEGTEVVIDALTQLATGHAHSHELMAWIDDLRDPDRQDPEPQLPEGLLHDFVADTELSAGALEVPGGGDDAPPVATENTDTSTDDADYFFSATRKRKLEEDGEDEEAPADGEVKPAAVKAPKVKTTKKP